MIYFAWCHEKDIFSKEVHCIEEEKVFDLLVEQKEGEAAHATLTLAALAVEEVVGTPRWMWVSWKKDTGEVVPLLKGYFGGLIKESKGDLATIELSARSLAQEEAFMAALKERPHWDELLVGEERAQDPESYLSASLETLHWDPCDHTLETTGFFDGEMMNVGGHFERESLLIKEVGKPSHSVVLRLHAQWVQRDAGTVNIFQRLSRQFPRGRMNSLTGVSFKNRWPKAGLRLGRSGYGVGLSELREVNPSYTGPLNVYPRYAGPFVLRDGSGEEKTYVIPRHWYTGKLYLFWKYRQKRHETLEIKLDHGVQQGVTTPDQVRYVDITLQNIYPPGDAMVWKVDKWYRRGSKIATEDGRVWEAIRGHESGKVFDETLWRHVSNFYAPRRDRRRGTFFLTKRGRKIARLGVRMARRELAKSARSLHISFRGPWEDLAHIRTCHRVTIEDDRLPGGRASGKVLSYQWVCHGDTGERFVNVTIGSSLGREDTQTLSTKAQDPVMGDGVVRRDVLCDGSWENVDGVLCGPFDDQKPRGGIVNMDRAYGNRFVRGVIIKNTAAEQADALRSAKTLTEMKNVLQINQTIMHVIFWDLRTQPCLHHTIRMPIGGCWSPPQDVVIESEVMS